MFSSDLRVHIVTTVTAVLSIGRWRRLKGVSKKDTGAAWGGVVHKNLDFVNWVDSVNWAPQRDSDSSWCPARYVIPEIVGSRVPVFSSSERIVHHTRNQSSHAEIKTTWTSLLNLWFPGSTSVFPLQFSIISFLFSCYMLGEFVSVNSTDPWWLFPFFLMPHVWTRAGYGRENLESSFLVQSESCWTAITTKLKYYLRELVNTSKPQSVFLTQFEMNEMAAQIVPPISLPIEWVSQSEAVMATGVE